MRTSVQTAGSVQGLASREVIVEGATTRSPLMLIHGAWLSARSWDPFAEYFRERGYEVSAPEWPRKQGDVEELREATDAIAGLGLAEIVDHYEEQIRALEQEPILIGHSFGGLIVELLLDRGLARGGVAISPAPPKGILVLPFSSLKAGLPGTGASVALARRRAAHARGVHLRFREHVHTRGCKGRVREVLRPGDRSDLPRGGFRELPSAPPDRAAFQVRGAGTAAHHRGDAQDHTVPASAAKKQFKSTRSPRRRRTTSSLRAGHT